MELDVVEEVKVMASFLNRLQQIQHLWYSHINYNLITNFSIALELLPVNSAGILLRILTNSTQEKQQPPWSVIRRSVFRVSAETLVILTKNIHIPSPSPLLQTSAVIML